jgi:hypothetical protein
MPTYSFKDTRSQDCWGEYMSIAEKEKFLEDNPNVIQLISSPSIILDSLKLGRKKPDSAFRDKLKEIKKAHPLGGGINTF